MFWHSFVKRISCTSAFVQNMCNWHLISIRGVDYESFCRSRTAIFQHPTRTVAWTPCLPSGPLPTLRDTILLWPSKTAMTLAAAGTAARPSCTAGTCLATCASTRGSGLTSVGSAGTSPLRAATSSDTSRTSTATPSPTPPNLFLLAMSQNSHPFRVKLLQITGLNRFIAVISTKNSK